MLCFLQDFFHTQQLFFLCFHMSIQFEQIFPLVLRHQRVHLYFKNFEF